MKAAVAGTACAPNSLTNRVAAGHAAANTLWVSYAGPVTEDAPPSGLITPDGTWATRYAAGAPGLAVTDVTTSTDSPARTWRRTARTTLRD